MATNKISKMTKIRLFWIGIPSLFIIAYTIFLGISYYINIVKLSNQEAELKEILTELQKDEKELKTDIKKLKDPEYIAKYAREHYLYSKDGEYVIKLEEDKLVVEETEKSKKDTYIKSAVITASIIGIFILLILIVSLKKRKKKNN